MNKVSFSLHRMVQFNVINKKTGPLMPESIF